MKIHYKIPGSNPRVARCERNVPQERIKAGMRGVTCEDCIRYEHEDAIDRLLRDRPAVSTVRAPEPKQPGARLVRLMPKD